MDGKKMEGKIDVKEAVRALLEESEKVKTVRERMRQIYEEQVKKALEAEREKKELLNFSQKTVDDKYAVMKQLNVGNFEASTDSYLRLTLQESINSANYEKHEKATKLRENTWNTLWSQLNTCQNRGAMMSRLRQLRLPLLSFLDRSVEQLSAGDRCWRITKQTNDASILRAFPETVVGVVKNFDEDNKNHPYTTISFKSGKTLTWSSPLSFIYTADGSSVRYDLALWPFCREFDQTTNEKLIQAMSDQQILFMDEDLIDNPTPPHPPASS